MFGIGIGIGIVIRIEFIDGDPDSNKNHLVNKYALIIYYSEADRAFIVEVPEPPGCMADGQSSQKSLAHADVVIQEWIDTAQELGRPIPEARGRLLFA